MKKCRIWCPRPQALALVPYVFQNLVIVTRWCNGPFFKLCRCDSFARNSVWLPMHESIKEGWLKVRAVIFGDSRFVGSNNFKLQPYDFTGRGHHLIYSVIIFLLNYCLFLFHPFPLFLLSWEGDPDVAVEMHLPKCAEDVCANEPSLLRRCALLQSGFFSAGAGYCVTWKQLWWQGDKKVKPCKLQMVDWWGIICWNLSFTRMA